MTTERQPWARWMSPEGMARHHARGNRCDRLRCHEKAVIQTDYRAEGRTGWDERFFCEPHGRAFAARCHVEIEAAPMEPVPWPVCWRIHPDDAAREAARGKHCETRRCREPIAMVTWRYWRSAAAGRVLVAEHEVCVQHGREFAERHGIDVEAAPPERSLR